MEQATVEQVPTTLVNAGNKPLVANTPVIVLQANAERQGFIISAGAADVWLFYVSEDGQDAQIIEPGVGHCVRAGGPPFEDTSWKGEVEAVSAAASSVGFTERLLNRGDDQG